MPTNTDLVTDLPADFAVFGQAVATSMADLLGGTTGQILSKTTSTDMDFTWINNDQGDLTAITAGTGISVTSPTGPIPTVAIDATVATLTGSQTLTNKTLTSPALTTPTISTLTTNGDLLYGTGSGALTRLGIGSSAQVLTVASGVPSWTTPTAAAQNFSLLNSGGTALTGSATVTVSGISGMNQLFIVLDLASASGATGPAFGFRFNTDTGSNYSRLGGYVLGGGTVGPVTTASGTFAGGADFSSNANSAAWGGLMLFGCNSTGIKTYSSMFTTDAAGGANNSNVSTSGIYSGSSTISSVSAFVAAGIWDAGRIYIYGSA